MIRDKLLGQVLTAISAAIVVAGCGSPAAPSSSTPSPRPTLAPTLAPVLTPALTPNLTPTLPSTETAVPASPSPQVSPTVEASPSPEPNTPANRPYGCDPSYVAPYGIDMYDLVDDEAGLAEMQAAGSHWVTTMLYWFLIEPNAPIDGVPSRDWSSFDTKVANAQAAGLEVFVLFTANPDWAAALPGGPVTNTLDLVNFATAAVERYDGDGTDDAPGSPVITYWSFYAEPDNGSLWYAERGKGYWGNNGPGLAQLLTQLTPAIHAANPQAKVLIGGLGYDYFTTEGGPFNRDFLASVLGALSTYPGGVSAYLDAMAFHFYPISAKRWPTIRDKAQEIRAIMSQYGADSLPLLVPEMGYWSDPAVGSSEPWQAEYLVQMFAGGLAAGIQQLSWFKVFDEGTGSEMHGLFRNHSLAEPKPAYTAYATMTAELAGARYLRDITEGGAAGYVFSTCDSAEKYVVWTGLSNSSVAVSRSCVRRVDLLGGVVQIGDGTGEDLDGATNGQVLVNVGRNDLFYLGDCR